MRRISCRSAYGNTTPGDTIQGLVRRREARPADPIAPALDIDGTSAAHPQTQEILDDIMAPLVTYPTTLRNGILVPNHRTPNVVGRLAASDTHTGNTWTFQLRKGVKSCAGNELTADDVVYAFEGAISLTGASPTAWFNAHASGIVALTPALPEAAADDRKLHGEVVETGPYTVRIKQLIPSESILRRLCLFALYSFDSEELRKHATGADPWSHLDLHAEHRRADALHHRRALDRARADRQPHPHRARLLSTNHDNPTLDRRS